MLLYVHGQIPKLNFAHAAAAPHLITRYILIQDRQLHTLFISADASPDTL